MIRLDKSLRAWGTREFSDVLKAELEQLQAGQLPLQDGLSIGNYVADEPFTCVINHMAERDGMIRVSLGIFFGSVIGGCSCTDDPTPASEINEYCEVQLDIVRGSAAATFALVDDN